MDLSFAEYIFFPRIDLHASHRSTVQLAFNLFIDCSEVRTTL